VKSKYNASARLHDNAEVLEMAQIAGTIWTEIVEPRFEKARKIMQARNA